MVTATAQNEDIEWTDGRLLIVQLFIFSQAVPEQQRCGPVIETRDVVLLNRHAHLLHTRKDDLRTSSEEQ